MQVRAGDTATQNSNRQATGPGWISLRSHPDRVKASPLCSWGCWIWPFSPSMVWLLPFQPAPARTSTNLPAISQLLLLPFWRKFCLLQACLLERF